MTKQYSDKTTVTYTPAENDPVLVKRTPGSSQLFRVEGESNRLYNVNVSSQHYSVADTSTTARISRIQLQDDIAHSQADLGTSSTGDSKESRLGLRYVPSTADIHSKGTTTLVMQGAPQTMPNCTKY